jgi:CubicO group peptidase (beta-lactamase class C family)
MRTCAAIFLSLLVIAARSHAAVPCSTTRFEGGVPVTTCVKADPRFASIRAGLLEDVKAGRVASASVAVVSGDAVLWEESIGWSDKERKIAATPHTGYLLASLGKSMTATALMRLVEVHKIELDAPISRYLGDAHLTIHEGAADAVTVRRVLDMTAELPHSNLTFSSLAARRAYTTEAFVRNRGHVVFPPGEVFLYSNTDFGVIEQVIEHVSGTPYRAFMRKALFAPMGMTDSSVGPDAPLPAPARKYDDETGKFLPPGYPVPESSRAVYSSVDDLIRYARLHLCPSKTSVLRADSIQEMHTRRSDAPHARFGLGIGVIDLAADRPWLLTDGRDQGAQSALSMLPREQVAAICLMNTTGGQADQVAFHMTDVFAPGFLDQVGKRMTEYETWGQRPYKPSPDLLGEWQGTIATTRGDLPVAFTFQPDGDVHVKVGNQLETLISGIGYDDGLLSGTFLADIPAEEAAGHLHRVTISLRQVGTRLSGFVTSEITNERGKFSLPSYAAFQKK